MLGQLLVEGLGDFGHFSLHTVAALLGLVLARSGECSVDFGCALLLLLFVLLLFEEAFSWSLAQSELTRCVHLVLLTVLAIVAAVGGAELLLAR